MTDETLTAKVTADGIPWDAVLRRLDQPPTRQSASNALTALLDPKSKKGGDIAAMIAPMVVTLQTPEGKSAALRLLIPYEPTVPAVLSTAVVLATNESAQVRVVAAQLLAQSASMAARTALLSLLNDPDTDVANFALSALPGLLAEASGDAQSSLRILPDDEERQRALELLDSLKRHVRTLDDLPGLDEAQHEIIDKLVLPDIDQLVALFGGTGIDAPDVVKQRGQSLVTLGRVLGVSQAVALAVQMLANGKDAAQNVVATAQELEPVIELLKRLLHL